MLVCPAAARPTAALVALVVLVGAATPAWSDATTPDYFGRGRNQVVVQAPAERTPAQRWLLRGLVGGGVVLAGVGVYFNLDSRAAAAEVSADTPTNQVWGPRQVELVDRAHRSGQLAIVGYAAGAAALLAAGVVAWRTEPGPGRAVVVGAARPTATVVQGGAVVGVSCGF